MSYQAKLAALLVGLFVFVSLAVGVWMETPEPAIDIGWALVLD